MVQGRELTQFVADFTWYLRNLLLVKTADGIEDVIDVSTENLARLKEEAKMAENDVIMRYIRVLSELSGQLRFATQKRIQIEMALIRLCRPQMQTDIRSLTDRVRQLEEKLEQGISMVPDAETLARLAGGMGDVGNGVSGTGVKKEQAPLPQAVPEDVKAVVSKWSVAIAEAPNPMKTYLKSAYPSLDGAGHLLVIVEEGLAGDYFKQPVHKEELAGILSGYAGKAIEVNVQSNSVTVIPETHSPTLQDWWKKAFIWKLKKSKKKRHRNFNFILKFLLW